MSKVWKRILLAILIIACLFNIVSKLVRRYPLKEELKASAQYVLNNNTEKEENK